MQVEIMEVQNEIIYIKQLRLLPNYYDPNPIRMDRLTLDSLCTYFNPKQQAQFQIILERK